MQFSPTSCHFISLWSKYSSQHPVLKHTQSNYELRGRIIRKMTTSGWKENLEADTDGMSSVPRLQEEEDLRKRTILLITFQCLVLIIIKHLFIQLAQMLTSLLFPVFQKSNHWTQK
jgi:hypothetical protein